MKWGRGGAIEESELYYDVPDSASDSLVRGGPVP